MSIARVRQLISDKEDKTLGYATRAEFPTEGRDFVLYLAKDEEVSYFWDDDIAAFIEFTFDNKPDWIFFSNNEIDLQLELDGGNAYKVACSLIPMMIQRLGKEMEAEKTNSGIESTTYSSLADRRLAMQKAYDMYQAKIHATELASNTNRRVFGYSHTPIAGME